MTIAAERIAAMFDDALRAELAACLEQLAREAARANTLDRELAAAREVIASKTAIMDTVESRWQTWAVELASICGISSSFVPDTLRKKLTAYVQASAETDKRCVELDEQALALEQAYCIESDYEGDGPPLKNVIERLQAAATRASAPALHLSNREHEAFAALFAYPEEVGAMEDDIEIAKNAIARATSALAPEAHDTCDVCAKKDDSVLCLCFDCAAEQTKNLAAVRKERDDMNVERFLEDPTNWTDQGAREICGIIKARLAAATAPPPKSDAELLFEAEDLSGVPWSMMTEGARASYVRMATALRARIEGEP